MERGFTFLEIVILVLTLGIVGLLGMPMLNSSMVEARLSSAASEVATALQFAQLTAVSSGRECRVTFDATTDSILVEQMAYATDFLGSETELTEASVETGAYATLKHPLNPVEDYNILFPNEGRFGGVDMVEAIFGSGSSVAFDSLGSPSDGGTVKLGMGARQITLSVDAMTGKVTQTE